MKKSELPTPEILAKDAEEIKCFRDKMEELNKRYPFYGYMELNLSIQCSLVSYQEKIDKLSRIKTKTEKLKEDVKS